MGCWDAMQGPVPGLGLPPPTRTERAPGGPDVGARRRSIRFPPKKVCLDRNDGRAPEVPPTADPPQVGRTAAGGSGTALAALPGDPMVSFIVACLGGDHPPVTSV